tara:strand:+ start:63 stop:410 length:348 start_codon:yes stop_codon:yes gene_type:complete
MVIKTIIFIVIGYIIQLSALNWFSILIYAAFIGAGSSSYKQSLILGLCIGVIPWLIQFAFYYNSAIILLNRISMMFFNFQSANLLIVLTLVMIALLSVLISMSTYYIKGLLYDRK